MTQRTHGIFLVDQIAASINAAEVPLTTAQVAFSAPPLIARLHCTDPCPRVVTHTHVIKTWCDGTTHYVLRRRLAPEVYPLLRLLQKRSLVESWKVPGDRRSFWVWTGPAGIPLEQLERIWNTPPTQKEHH